MKTYILLLTSLFFYSLAQSQDEQIRNLPKEQLASIDGIVTSLLSKANLPGLSIAIKKDGQVVFAKAYGYADIEEQRVMTVNTRLRTASVAKVMTITAIGKLVTEGKLDLNAPISNYVDGLNNDYKNITARQLAGHLSGIKHRPQKKVKNKLYTSIDEALGLFVNSKLEHQPGTKYKYSTNGYTLLSAVIEGAAKMSYLEFMDKEIFEVLGMRNSRPEIKSLIDEADASLYAQKGTKLKKEKKWANPSVKWAGAGFRTTPIDLVNMMDGYTNGLIKSEVVSDLFKSLKLIDGSATHVGVGWRTNVDPFGRTWRDHAGNWQGTRSVIAYCPEENLSISIMVNCRWDGFIEETAHVIAGVLLGNDELRQPVNMNKDIAALFVNFQGEEKLYKGSMELKDGDGKLLSNSEGFLKNMPLIYLGHDGHYAAITPYGVMYMHLNPKDSKTIGRLFMYGSMRDVSPTEGQASVIVSYLN